jgi:hypothetical protein
MLSKCRFIHGGHLPSLTSISIGGSSQAGPLLHLSMRTKTSWPHVVHWSKCSMHMILGGMNIDPTMRWRRSEGWRWWICVVAKLGDYEWFLSGLMGEEKRREISYGGGVLVEEYWVRGSAMTGQGDVVNLWSVLVDASTFVDKTDFIVPSCHDCLMSCINAASCHWWYSWLFLEIYTEHILQLSMKS